MKDVSKFGVVSVTKKHCSTSLVKTVELQAQMPQESKLCITPQLTRKTTVNFQTKNKGRVCITGCDILPDGKLVFVDETGKRLLMFSKNGNCGKDIVRFSDILSDVSCTGENINISCGIGRYQCSQRTSIAHCSIGVNVLYIVVTI